MRQREHIPKGMAVYEFIKQELKRKIETGAYSARGHFVNPA
jgi:DNA-binding GntR family transcriptional regulator